jgi:hypothetical protein
LAVLLGLAIVEDGRDVRVVQRRGVLGLGPEARAERCIAVELAARHLHREGTLEQGVAGDAMTTTVVVPPRMSSSMSGTLFLAVGRGTPKEAMAGAAHRHPLRPSTPE